MTPICGVSRFNWQFEEELARRREERRVYREGAKGAKGAKERGGGEVSGQRSKVIREEYEEEGEREKY
jgi:hypothetical protein